MVCVIFLLFSFILGTNLCDENVFVFFFFNKMLIHCVYRTVNNIQCVEFNQTGLRKIWFVKT